MSLRVAIASCDGAARHEDDLFLGTVLKSYGASVDILSWRERCDWGTYDAVLPRSTWDYHRDLDSFLAWSDRIEAAGARLFNPARLIRWNCDKSYLRALAANGVATVPTVWVEPEEVDLVPEILLRENWLSAVVKPSVSANAHNTFRIELGRQRVWQPQLAQACWAGRIMVQPFLEEITAGELSLIFIEGQFSHAVRKIPRAGDFRVQRDHGGSEEPCIPTREILDCAHRVIGALHEIPLYARIDGVLRQGAFLVIELELIEPVLFLSSYRPATQRLAAALLARLGAHRDVGDVALPVVVPCR